VALGPSAVALGPSAVVLDPSAVALQLRRVLDRSRALGRGPWPVAGQPAIGKVLSTSVRVVGDPVAVIRAGWPVIRGPCMSSAGRVCHPVNVQAGSRSIGSRPQKNGRFGKARAYARFFTANVQENSFDPR